MSWKQQGENKREVKRDENTNKERKPEKVKKRNRKSEKIINREFQRISEVFIYVTEKYKKTKQNKKTERKRKE